MILPIIFMWKQLNGPQITAISQALFDYMKSVFDDKLNYINNISIETANDDHLTFLGLLSGLVRPIVKDASREWFFFTEEYESNVTHGFSSLLDPGKGGRFNSAEGEENTRAVRLNVEHYRALLRAWENSEGELGSLELLDNICYELSRLDLGMDIDPFYRFKFMQGESIPEGRAPGDLYLDLGQADTWKNADHIYAVLKSVAESVYYPQPQIFVSIATDGRVVNPVSNTPSGTYQGPINVVLECDTQEATIYYTTDGSTPDENSLIYTSAITITTSTTIKAIGIAEDFGNSDIVSFSYIIE